MGGGSSKSVPAPRTSNTLSSPHDKSGRGVSGGSIRRRRASNAAAEIAVAVGSSGESKEKRYNKATYDKIEKGYVATLLEPKKLRTTWNEIAQTDPTIDDHVDMVTLADVVTYLIKKHGGLLRHSAALYKAYQLTCMLESTSDDAWVVPADLPPLLSNIFYSNKLYAAFGIDDESRDKVLTYTEFVAGAKKIGLTFDDGPKMAWAMLHPNTKQRLPFNTFADWYLKGTLNEGIKESTASFLAGEDLHYYLNDEIGDEKKGKTAPTKTTRRSKHVLSGKVLDEEIAMLDRIVHEEGILELAQNVDKLNAFWKEIAHSDGNVVSPTVKLEDVGVWIKKKFPMLDHGNALSQAYRRTQITSKKADDSGRWVSTDDCPALLAHLVFYNKILMCFDHLDIDGDKSIDWDEFKIGLAVLGIVRSDVEGRAEFDKLDMDNTGEVYYKEFTIWYINEVMPKKEIEDTAAQFSASNDLDFYMNAA